MVTNQNWYKKENKIETESKEIYQKPLYFITIEIIKVEQQNYPKQDIIT